MTCPMCWGYRSTIRYPPCACHRAAQIMGLEAQPAGEELAHAKTLLVAVRSISST